MASDSDYLSITKKEKEMAKVLEGHEAVASTGKMRYPWDEWMDGQSRLLVRGEDYTCQDASITTSAQYHAKIRQLRVKCEKVEEGYIVTAYKEQIGDMTPAKKKQKATA